MSPKGGKGLVQKNIAFSEYMSSLPCVKKTQIPVAILVRVSSSRQETERQIEELQDYAKSQGYEVVEILKETISGKADESEREGLIRCEELARAGKIKKVLVHEVSRIARRNSIAHRFVETMEDLGVSVYWKAQNLETLLPNGKRSHAAGIMLAIMAEAARNEVEVLSMRVRSGLAQAKRNGVKLGRPVGSSIPVEMFMKKHSDIVRLLKSDHSVRNTAKITGKGFSTVQRVKTALRNRRTDLAAC
jgi:DNA invertase Pin-like site-specific DNA recombinase